MSPRDLFFASFSIGDRVNVRKIGKYAYDGTLAIFLIFFFTFCFHFRRPRGSMESLWGGLRVSWGSLGGPLGVPGRSLGGPLGVPWGSLGGPWGPLGHPRDHPRGPGDPKDPQGASEMLRGGVPRDPGA